MSKIDQVGALSTTQLHDNISLLNIFIDCIWLVIDILIREDAVLADPEVHETIFGVKMPVSPMVSLVIRTNLIK
jgi:hypothetical protein